MLEMRNNKMLLGKLFKCTRYYHNAPFLLLLILVLIPYALADWNPYEILGVRRDANLDQIKKAYREMAKKLHPDKSDLNEDEAGRKFIELNKAFSILKDPNRKSRFDLHGDIEESRHGRGYHNHQHQNRQTREYWTHHGPFTFFSSSESYFRRKSITSKQYYKDFVNDSKHKLFFIFFYAEFCPSCSLIESAWTKITDELENHNMGSFTINVHHESRLSQELGVNTIPHIACLIDGQIKPYHQSELSLASIVKFVRSILPKNLIRPLDTEEEQDRFLASGPQQNRLSAIIIHNDMNLKLRYLLIAYELRLHYQFGHISTKSARYSLFTKHYNLAIDHDSRQTHVMVFDENIKNPSINLKFNLDSTSIAHLKKELLKWPFLQLPRLSSQPKFDDLCLYAIPRDGKKTSSRLCIILFTSYTPSTLPMRTRLVEFITVNQLGKSSEVVFTYIDFLKQSEFTSSLLLETKETYPFKIADPIEGAIITIERHPHHSRKAVHKWISARWNAANMNELDRAKLELHQIISDYKRNSITLVDKVALTSLIDEDGPYLITRVLWRLVNYTLRLTDYVTSRESISVIIAMAICALLTSFFLVSSQSSQNQNESTKDQLNDIFANGGASADELRIIELKAETYNGMIRLLKPGYRCIILLSDRETREKLLTQFRKAVWPYRRNKTLLFGQLCLDKHLDWYKLLLQQVTGLNELNVNKKNCIGTVLSLNGFKKYFRVYHAKHREFEFFDEEGNSDFDERFDPEALYGRTTEALCTDNLLDGLPIWLDKMFDGMTKRYFISNWPEEIN